MTNTSFNMQITPSIKHLTPWEIMQIQQAQAHQQNINKAAQEGNYGFLLGDIISSIFGRNAANRRDTKPSDPNHTFDNIPTNLLDYYDQQHQTSQSPLDYFRSLPPSENTTAPAPNPVLSKAAMDTYAPQSQNISNVPTTIEQMYNRHRPKTSLDEWLEDFRRQNGLQL